MAQDATNAGAARDSRYHRPEVLRVDDATKYVEGIRAAERAAAARAPAAPALTAEVGPYATRIVDRLEALSADVAALCEAATRPGDGGGAAMSAAIVSKLDRVSAEVESLGDAIAALTRAAQAVSGPPMTTDKLTATATSGAIAAIKSTEGRTAILGAVVSGMDSAPVRQVVRDSILAALGSKEGRTLIRGILTEALNGHDQLAARGGG